MDPYLESLAAQSKEQANEYIKLGWGNRVQVFNPPDLQNSCPSPQAPKPLAEALAIQTRVLENLLNDIGVLINRLDAVMVPVVGQNQASTPEPPQTNCSPIVNVIRKNTCTIGKAALSIHEVMSRLEI